jgi:hypothetical protein
VVDHGLDDVGCTTVMTRGLGTGVPSQPLAARMLFASTGAVLGTAWTRSRTSSAIYSSNTTPRSHRAPRSCARPRRWRKLDRRTMPAVAPEQTLAARLQCSAHTGTTAQCTHGYKDGYTALRREDSDVLSDTCTHSVRAKVTVSLARTHVGHISISMTTSACTGG